MEKVNNLEESVIFFFREIVKNKIYVNYFLQSHNIWYYLFVVRILEKKRLLWKFQALKHFKSCAGYGIIPTEDVYKRQVWICRNCGYLHVAEKAPEACPVCRYPKDYFERYIEKV